MFTIIKENRKYWGVSAKGGSGYSLQSFITSKAGNKGISTSIPHALSKLYKKTDIISFKKNESVA